MPFAYSTKLVDKPRSSLRKYIHKVAHHLLLLLLIRHLQLSLTIIVPLTVKSPFFQRNHQNVNVIVSPEDMLMRVDNIVRKLIANLVKLIFIVDLVPEQMIHTIPPTLQRKERLLLEEHPLPLSHLIIFI